MTTIDQVISPPDVYWITRLDWIKEVLSNLTIPFVILAVGLVFFTIMGAIEEEWSTVKKLLKWAALSTSAAVVLSVGSAFIPTTKEMCAILVIPKLANNQEIQGLGTDVVGLARAWLDELKPKEAK